ncbi:hypothetical protein ACLM5H_11395 [Fredinandcohnia humi]
MESIIKGRDTKMSKKKAIKVLTTAAVAASAFVAANPASAAPASDAQTLVKKAKDAGTVLKWAISVEGSADFKTRPYAQYNAAKDAYAKAVAAVNKLSGAEKTKLLTDLEQNVNVHIKRTMAYIDAITAGEKINATKAVLQGKIDANVIDSTTTTAYHNLSKEIRKQAILLDRVYGQTTRDGIRDQFKKTAEALRDSVASAVTVEMALTAAEKALDNKDDIAAAKHLEDAAYNLSNVKSTVLKGKLTERLAAADAKLTPAVTSVSSINGKQLVVKFNKPVSKATVLNDKALHSNITVSRIDADAVDPKALTATLSADGKTLTITATDYFKGRYTVATSEEVKTSTGVKLTKHASVVVVDDKTAPRFISASAVAKESTKDLTVVFDEPVQSTGVIAYVNGEAATVETGSDLNTLTVKSSASIKAGTKVEVSLLNVKDAAGNLTNPNPLVTTVTVVADTVNPVVSSIAVVGEGKVNVTFSKEVTNNDALKEAVSLLDPNGVKVGPFTFVKVQSNGKTVEYTAPDFTFGPNNTFTGTLLVQNTVTDTLGNKMVDKYSSSVTFSKDTVAPVAQKAEYKDGKLSVTFSEDVAEVLLGAKSGLKIINKNTGAEIEVSGSVAVDKDNSNVFVLTQNISAGSYELRLPAAQVKDISKAGNKNAAVILDFTVAAASTSDKNAPKFTYAASTTNLDITFKTVVGAPDSEQVFAYTVQDDSGIDVATVRNLNNYTLNGKALPAGSYITTDYDSSNVKAALTVKIYVPSSKIDKTNNESILVVSGVKDASGNVANPQVSEKISVYDGVAPEVKSAVISSGDKSVLVVDFTEEVVNFDKADDVVLTVNGKEITASVAKQETGTDKGKYYVTGTGITDFTAQSTVTLKLAKEEAGAVADKQGNLAVFGKTITIK